MKQAERYLNRIKQSIPNFSAFKEHVKTTLNSRKERTVDPSLNITQNAGVLFLLIVPKVIANGTRDLAPPELFDNIYLLLEKRSTDMNSHPGDLAFPGGTIEQQDNDLIDTAIREAHEEVGVDISQPEFIAFMDEFVSSSKVLVKPVICWLIEDLPLSNFRKQVEMKYYPRTRESDHTVVIPLSHCINPVNYSSTEYYRSGKQVGYVRYFDIDHFLHDDHIWGLTATMIRRFIDIVFHNNPLPAEPLD